MHYRFITAVVVAMSVATVASAQSPETKLAQQKGWLLDLAAGKTLAKKTGKPMLIVFRCDP